MFIVAKGGTLSDVDGNNKTALQLADDLKMGDKIRLMALHNQFAEHSQPDYELIRLLTKNSSVNINSVYDVSKICFVSV